MVAEDVVVAKRVTEEAEAVETAAARLLAVRMARETGHHGDVGVDGVTQRHARIRLDDVVVFGHPFHRLALIDEGEGERAEPMPCRLMDGVALGAGNPQRRVRLLHRLGHDVAAGHGEVFAR